jgi:hypothetical protein
MGGRGRREDRGREPYFQTQADTTRNSRAYDPRKSDNANALTHALEDLRFVLKYPYRLNDLYSNIAY